MLHRVIKSGLTGLLWLMVCTAPVTATTIIIINNDNANEGFNDPTPVAPIGGNSGTTLGQQRFIVVQQAASKWESIINSNVQILVQAKFDPLPCTAMSAVLASAGPSQVFRDFNSAPLAQTYYPVALANSLAGTDLSASHDIDATFNVDIDNNNNCVNGYNWYYGIDDNKPSNTFELLSVVVHELGHGLGFLTFVDTSTGEKFRPGPRPQAYNDHFMVHLEDHSLGMQWSDTNMSNSQRQASAIDTADLHWTGSNVTSKLSLLSGGVNQGHVRMFAPSPWQQGSSVSHFSTELSPNELMEPFDTGPKQDIGLARELFQDIGWSVVPRNIAPGIAITAPTNNAGFSEGSTVMFQATANDLEDGNLSSSVFWSSSRDGGLGSGNIINAALTSGNHQITASVTDSASSTVTANITVNINTNPVVTINAPANDENFAEGSSVMFQAVATDTEEGDLSSLLFWVSSIDGSLGSGNVINNVLSAGSHIITASVIDSFPGTGTASISVSILGDSDADGMNDAWEINAFGNLSRDGAGDFDGDGITDLDEYLISVTVPNGDINNDGQINVADVLLATRHTTSLSTLSALQIARGDLYPSGSPDGVFNLSDLILLQKIINNIP
jgi:hypothetical protein